MTCTHDSDVRMDAEISLSPFTSVYFIEMFLWLAVPLGSSEGGACLMLKKGKQTVSNSTGFISSVYLNVFSRPAFFCVPSCAAFLTE